MLVMDKHSAHYGEPKGVRQFITQYFRPFFLPSSTCWLNSTETLFAVMKDKIKKHFLLIDENIDDPALFVRMVEQFLQNLSSELRNSRLHLANLKDIKETIYQYENR